MRHCLTCILPAPGEGTDPWRCTGCGLRGDLDADAPANKYLAAKIEREAAVAAAAAAAVRGTGSKSGKIRNETSAGSTLSKREKLLERLASAGPSHPTFSGKGADRPMTPAQAMAEVRKSHKATATPLPSDALLVLVRKGKLQDVGFAVPVPLASGLEEDEGRVRAPPVDGPAQLSHAIFATILPALIDRPAAGLQWVALARTVLEISMDPALGWAPAQAYATQLLNARVNAGQDFAAVDDQCLTNVRHSFAYASQSEWGGPPQRAEGEAPQPAASAGEPQTHGQESVAANQSMEL